MDLKTYYKIHVYDYGYNKGYEKKKNILLDDIYFNDEMDFFICADYYGSYVGDVDAWHKEDEAFLRGLGFDKEDFVEE